jgi:hypothetical protein
VRLRLRADHPALQADPLLPHRAATDACVVLRTLAPVVEPRDSVDGPGVGSYTI